MLDHLALDGPAGFRLPLPDRFFELPRGPDRGGTEFPWPASWRATTICGGDAGVVGARQPQRDVAAHAVPADGDVDFGVLQHVAHVERRR